MKSVFLLLALAGCAAPQPVFKPVEIDMPVALPCATTPPAPPDFALAHVTPTDSLFAKTRAALIELDQRKAFEAELQAQINSCQ